MCAHQWKKINDVYVCVRCGLTKIYEGPILFDRHLPNVNMKKRKKK